MSLALALAGPAAAQEVGASKEVDLKKQVQLLGAQGNDKFQQDVEPGDVKLSLTLAVTLPAKPAQTGELATSNFAAEGKAPHRVAPTLAGGGGRPSSDTPQQVSVPLQRSRVAVDLALAGLRPNTMYRGQLLLVSGTAAHTWDIALKTADRGVLAVDKIPMRKLVILHPCSLVDWWAALASLTRCRPGSDWFTITLRDASGQGPYSNVRVRFDEVRAPTANALSSNFSIDALSFWIGDGGGRGRVDLAMHAGTVAAGDASMMPRPTVPKESQVTLRAQAESLSPGEYAGVLRFGADGASEQAEESKLALTLQVRHHWTLAVIVALFGAATGWFVNKFAQGYRTGRRFLAEGRALSDAAAFLARPEAARGGWQFPGEANTYALARVRVILHQVDRLARMTFVVIAAEQEIADRLAEARRRLAALDAFRATRLRVQPVTDNRPAAQRAVGRALRRALDVLDRPAFGDVQREEVTLSLKDLEAWLASNTRDALYRAAVLDRARDAREEAIAASFEAGDETPPEETLASQIRALLNDLKMIDAVPDRTPPALTIDDIRAARLALLLRDRETPWISTLVQERGEPLSTLFRIADAGLWRVLDSAAQQKAVRLVAPPETRVETYDPVEIRLTIDAPDLPDGQRLTTPDSRLVHHPCLVRWTIASPDGATRTVETDGLTLVQYFPEVGTVKVQAQLVWDGKKITVPDQLSVDVKQNPDYRLRAGLSNRVEFMLTGVAALFAILTGLSAVYDATFGSASQYITLFLWAAGASTVGNLAKQLGPSPTSTTPPAPAAPASVAPAAPAPAAAKQ